VPAFVEAFATLGYAPSGAESVEPGLEKVAIFADERGRPTHVARQLASGRWTSKLGRLEDIEHDLRDLESEAYGDVVQVMQRAIGAEQSKSTA
jgi:hypothetical protein